MGRMMDGLLGDMTALAIMCFIVDIALSSTVFFATIGIVAGLRFMGVI